MELKKDEYYKHFKGKNIYKILATCVTYTGDKLSGESNTLVVYQNIIDGNIFAREEEELLEELSKDKQEMYHQKYRIEKISKEEALGRAHVKKR